MKTFKVKDVVAAAILAALVFVLLRYVAIPTPLPDTTLSIHNAIIAFFAILYGPVVAFVGGFVGNLLVDITAGWGIWWSWIVPTGLFGLIIGLFCKFDLHLVDHQDQTIYQGNKVSNGYFSVACQKGKYKLTIEAIRAQGYIKVYEICDD